MPCADSLAYPTPQPPGTLHSPLDESQSGPSFWTSRRFSPKDGFAKYARDFKVMSEVRIRIPPERMNKLRKLASGKGHPGQAPYDQTVSRQDAISAYVACLLTHICEKSAPITFIRNNFNVSRSCDSIPQASSVNSSNDTPFYWRGATSDHKYRGNNSVSTNMIGTNTIVFIQTPTLGQDADIASIARSIRHSITRAKSADFARQDLIDAHSFMLDAANAGDCFCVLPPEGCLTINGNVGSAINPASMGNSVLTSALFQG